MVYYKGVWHLYHRFDDAPSHGNQVHWLHLTSTDLIHWDEQPMALYSDAYGAMFSGCAVVDEHNTSGLFSSDDGGLVAIITADGNGERLEIAHSEDDGLTWIKELSGIDQQFNGTYNLLLKAGVTQKEGKYLLTQTPIQQYEALRDTLSATVLPGVDVTTGNTLLDSFKGGTAKADIAVYPMNSIWNGEASSSAVTRSDVAQLPQLLYQKEGSPAASAPAFSDVAASSSSSQAIGWVSSKGIMTGHSGMLGFRSGALGGRIRGADCGKRNL